MLNKKILALTVAVAVLSACQSTPKQTNVGKKEFDISQQLMSSNQFVEAVSYLEQALNKNPNNKTYATLLASARQKAVIQITNSIKDSLTSKTINKANLDSVNALFVKAKSILPQHSSYTAIETLISEQQANLVAKVKGLYQGVKTNIASGEWIKAKFTVKKLLKLYPNYEDSMQLSQKIKIEGSRFYLTQANKFYQANDFFKTLEFARKSVTVNPASKKAKMLIAATNKKNNKEYFIALAQQAMEKSDWSAVYNSCKTALFYDAKNAYCLNQMTIAKAKHIDSLLTNTRQLLTQGFYMQSIAAYQEAVIANDGVSSAALTALKETLSDKMDLTAEDLMESALFGSAWYLYRLIATFNPEHEELFEKTKRSEDYITERIQKSIAVFNFKSPSYNEDAGGLVSNNLRSNLFKSASKDIKVLEREKLSELLEEMKLGQIGVVSESSVLEMGRIHGIDIAIMGSVLLYKVDSTEAISSETVRYQVGEEISDNIDYLNWKALNPKASKKELKEAPAAKIMVPTFEEKEYEVKNVKKVGFIQLSFRIVDVSTGVNTRVETIERTKIEEDRSNEGVRTAGVEFDPLEVLTDTELLQQITSTVVEELSRDVLQPLRNLEKKYFERGEDLYLRRKESLNAVERFVDAIFDEKLKLLVNSPITSQSNKYLDKIIVSHSFK